jgi:hypothetical protein
MRKEGAPLLGTFGILIGCTSDLKLADPELALEWVAGKENVRLEWH